MTIGLAGKSYMYAEKRARHVLYPCFCDYYDDFPAENFNNSLMEGDLPARVACHRFLAEAETSRGFLALTMVSPFCHQIEK